SDANTYSVVVSGVCGNPATNSATLTALDGTSITPLINRTNSLASTVTFSTIAFGSGPFSYRWMKDGVLILGQTNNVLTIASVTMADAGVYKVDVTGSCGTVSSSASLTVDGSTRIVNLRTVGTDVLVTFTT